MCGGLDGKVVMRYRLRRGAVYYGKSSKEKAPITESSALQADYCPFSSASGGYLCSGPTDD